MKSCGASSGCCTTSTMSAGRIRPTIRCKDRPSSASRGYPEEVIYAIKSHADYLTDCPRVSRLDKTLYACDELAGFITAVALMRPEKLSGMQASSVKKKLKQKSFAAAVSREDIARGAEDLGIPLDEHIQFVIDSLQPVAADLGLV